MSDTNVIKNTSYFYQNIAGNTSDIKDVDSTLDGYGDLFEVHGIDAIVLSVRKLLMTVKGTYPFDPEYGLGLHKYLFELNDDKTIRILEKEITRVLYNYESRAKFTVNIYPDEVNYNKITINLIVEYNGETRKTTLNFSDSMLKTYDE